MESSVSSCGVDVITTSNLSDHPLCPHGPTLLFERFTISKKGERSSQKFYACSACRDRKDCSFFQHFGDKVSEEKLKIREQQNLSLQPPHSHREMYKRFLEVKKLPPEKRLFCLECGVWIIEDKESHATHKTKHNVSDVMLRQPSTLMLPLADKKSNAQILFAKTSVQVIISHLEKMKYTHVICVGTVRLHEELILKRIQNPNYPIKSILLDIDHRYGSFFSPEQYCRYNMMNNYFFKNKTAEEEFQKFVKEPGAVLFTDPPFGGMIDALSLTIKTIMQVHSRYSESQTLPIYWIFPYYLEHRILQNFPAINMLDYKVEYENHQKFQNSEKGRKHGSPVRIFTNVAPICFDLSAETGYRYCNKCEKYVADNNLHCEKCDSCTSKDGKTYKHCDKCERCVKPSRIHCDKCNRCEMADHKCGVKPTGCHLCGDETHKRRECPNIESALLKRKRDKKEKNEKAFKRNKGRLR